MAGPILVPRRRHTTHEWTLRDPEALGLPLETYGRACIIEGQPWDESCDVFLDENGLLADLLGHHPASVVSLAMMSNGEPDHRVLAASAVSLARYFDALVHLGGKLDIAEGGDSRVRENARHLPGAVYQCPRETPRGRLTLTHILDADALAAWMAHPRFHMVK